MRFRLGNRHVDRHEGDGLGGCDQEDIIIDHCSVSWSIDECLSIYGNRNSTVQWCIVGPSLSDAGHSKGAHGFGGNWGGSGASYHHNLIIHNTSRTPRLGPRPSTQTDERMDLRNNVIYNWGGHGCYGGEAHEREHSEQLLQARACHRTAPHNNTATHSGHRDTHLALHRPRPQAPQRLGQDVARVGQVLR